MNRNTDRTTVRTRNVKIDHRSEEMKLQLSSGQGPAECELAVGKLLRALMREYPSIQILDTVRGSKADCYKSVLISCREDLTHLRGTIKWICQSPYRPKHKRKNWFVDVSLPMEETLIDYDETLVKFETFRSGGKGGQHVNKVETGVRAIYLPTGLAVVSTEARSQHMNKRIALDRLCSIITAHNQATESDLRACNRLERIRIERGNAVRTYQDMNFRRIE